MLSFNYLQKEVSYGCGLYVSGWKKLVFHPLQTVQDTAYAILHPLQTSKALLSEFVQHPLGFTINLGLSWSTGKLIKSTINYVDTYLETPNVKIRPDIPRWHNTTTACVLDNEFLASATPTVSHKPLSSNTLFSSVTTHMSQLSTQVATGGCCGGVCTTAGRLGQTSSLIAGQSATVAMNNKSKPSSGIWGSCKNLFFSDTGITEGDQDNCGGPACPTTFRLK